MRHPEIPEELRGTYAGLAHPASLALPRDAGRDRGRAAAGPPVRPRPAPARRQGLRNYWGYNSIGFFAPHNGYATPDRPGEQVAEFKAMVKALHAAGIEVILDVVYNHTAEGNHLGPDAVVQGHRQRGLLPPGRRRPALLHGLHGHRQHAQRAPPARAAADHGQPALLGHRDARRRLPLRPRVGARPGAPRGRPAVGVLRPHPPGPGRQPGEAHRRAVGRRRGRLPGRQLPGAAGRSGTASTATRCATSGAASRDAWRARLPPHRLAPTCTRRTAAARTRASTSSPPTTASRSRDLVSYNEKHNEANGEDNRDGSDDNRSWNCGAEGPTDDPDDHRAPRAGSSATSWPRCSCRRACRCCSAATRSAARSTATTTPTARTTRSRWFDWSPSDEPSCSSSRGGSSRSAASTRSSAAGAGSRAGRSTARTSRDIAWFTPDGTQMTDEDWERAVDQRRSGCSSAATAIAERRRARRDRIRDDSVPPRCFNAVRGRPLDCVHCPRRPSASDWERARSTRPHERRSRPGRTRCRRRPRSTVAVGSRRSLLRRG